MDVERRTPGSLLVTAPTNGENVKSGSQVSVSISGWPDVRSILVLVYCSSDSVQFAELNGPSAKWSFRVPPDAIGDIVIEALGAEPDGTILVSPSVTLNIAIRATLDSIEARPTKQFVTVGSQFGESLYGYYHDGVKRSLVGILGIVIESSNTAVVDAAVPDSIVALEHGSSTLTLTYQGRTTTIIVTVSPGSSMSVEPPALIRPTPSVILPITAESLHGRVSFRVAIEVENKSEDIVEATIFDVSGRVVKRQLMEEAIEAHSRKLMWDGTDQRGIGAPPGIYFARLRIGGLTGRVKFVLLR